MADEPLNLRDPEPIRKGDRVEVVVKGDGTNHGIVRAAGRRGYVVLLDSGRRVFVTKACYYPAPETIAERAAELRKLWPEGRISARSEDYVGFDGPGIREAHVTVERKRKPPA